MARPKIEGTGHGKPRMIFGSDGEHWYALHVDDDGRPHVVVEVNALPGGAATAANQAAIAALIGALTDPAGGTVNKQLLQLVTRMGTVVTPGGGTLLGLLTSILADTDDIIKHANLNILAVTKDLGVNVQGFNPVPATPVWEHEDTIVCATGDWRTVKSTSVTATQTWYITDLWIGPDVHSGTCAFTARLKVGGTEVWRRVFPDTVSGHINFQTPIKATTAQAVTLEVYQDTAGDIGFSGGFGGFEV